MTPDHVPCNSSIVFDRFTTTTEESFINKDHCWFADSHLPTDLILQVEGISFYVHKYILISRCEYFSRINIQTPDSDLSYDLKLDNFPGGSDTFESVLKFCYGLPIELTPANVAPLKCASEYLQMTEKYDEGNLISKTEAFLTFVVLSSWKDTITVLKSCEFLSPWVENLQIVRRCCDSTAWMVSNSSKSVHDEGWWFNDVLTLRIEHFVRIITGIRAKGVGAEILGGCIVKYAEKWLPIQVDVKNFEGGFLGYHGTNELRLSISSGKKEGISGGENKEKKLLIESIVSILPPQREAVSCKFLLWLLKMAVVYSASPALISELEKRVGMVLKDADVNDLLIPSYKNAIDQGKLKEDNTIHDVDMVHRIVEYFIMHEQQQQQETSYEKLNIVKLLDGYLAEIARDPHLTIAKFQILAEVLTEKARNCHDGLYRAIDTYLKSHPDLMEHDKRRLCKVMNNEKLSLDACLHAAQNERLPLRTVMQVLLSEQVKMRAAINTKEMILPTGSAIEHGNNLLYTNKEIKDIKAELDMVKTKMSELQNDYYDLQQEFEKLSNKQKHASGWNSGWKKIKNSFFQSRMDSHVTLSSDETSQQTQGGKSTGTGSRRRFSIS
ncbi:BTB/POZ domain-containing protein DOT3-like [Papaver somniferum]|uniref:BTB/POZ domain-containing protein DOT3-like n=1 Tax=Papaver somniferum TaxID=3469 RepID=UPI000E700526|nr:BTB/POZ domain-containing protein DOT3-like [Papaver somniferum]